MRRLKHLIFIEETAITLLSQNLQKIVQSAFVLIAFFCTMAQAAPLSQGGGHPALKQAIDPYVDQAMSEANIVGLTVAVTRQNKLLLGYGYGAAMNSGTKVTPMNAWKRTPIGSTGKALISGPMTWELLVGHGYNPDNTKLYGNNGLFSGKYDLDWQWGHARFDRIAAVAISKKGKVYTWMRDGKVHKGWSRDLAADDDAKTYTVPAGMTPRDIRAMAIAGNSGKVYTWWNNGGVTIGSSRNLDNDSSFDLDDQGNVEKVKMPSGLSMANVVGIGIAKSNDHVYIWYDNGTVSSGTSRDFTYYFVDRSYQGPYGNTPYRILAMAISKNDSVYAWYANGKTSTGWSRDLASERAPANYERPSMASLGGSYTDITTGQIFSHRTGFDGGGSIPGAMDMFGKPESDLTYADVHRHFLQTRALLFAPGTARSYSNHGMGLTTLMVKELSGESYRSYAINVYLDRFGLKNIVIPRTSNLGPNDSYQYNATSSGAVPFPATDSVLGLAAGGWSMNAMNMVKLSNEIVDRWGWSAAGRMGFGLNSKGAISHSGKTGGGASFIIAFPPGYIANSGEDLSDVHVAVASNTRISPSHLNTLASHIAKAVANANIPSNYEANVPKPPQ
ncbi:MAG: serine hydrolase [Reinekea sp.]